jgi:hypothetical protein
MRFLMIGSGLFSMPSAMIGHPRQISNRGAEVHVIALKNALNQR